LQGLWGTGSRAGTGRCAIRIFERHAIFNAARFLLALTPPFLALLFIG
jgi:hypothetical protein